MSEKYHPSSLIPVSWNLFKWLFVIMVFFSWISDFIFKIDILNPVRIFILFTTIFTFCSLMTLEIFYMWELPKIETDNDSNKQYLEKVIFHADGIYHRRVNFFLIAESMLIVSFVTSLAYLANDVNNIFLIRFAISILGMIFTFGWFYVNKRLDWRIVYLNTKIKKKKEYKGYLDSVGRYTLHSGLFMSNLLPASTFFFWYFLSYITWRGII